MSHAEHARLEIDAEEGHSAGFAKISRPREFSAIEALEVSQNVDEIYREPLPD